MFPLIFLLLFMVREKDRVTLFLHFPCLHPVSLSLSPLYQLFNKNPNKLIFQIFIYLFLHFELKM